MQIRFILLFLIFCGILRAQDGHYSLYAQQPLLLNPALSGAGPADIRIGGIYRSQWSQIKSTYTNFGAFADARYKNFSLNGYANQNKAGIKGYKKTNALIGIGYRQPLDNKGNALSIGAQLGLNQMSINTSIINFDNQYVPFNGFDERLNSGENFGNTTMKMTDINAGIVYHFNKLANRSIRGKVGFAFFHINAPIHNSAYGVPTKMPRRLMVHSSVEIPINSSFLIEPNFLYTRQLTASELLLGINLGFNQSDTSGFKLGLGTRYKDAIILQAIFRLNRVELGIGLDYNISTLNQAAAFNNAMEVSLVYNLSLKKASPTPKDSDEDGILDADDDCPKVFGIERLKGCPEDMAKKTDEPSGPDFDKDGILDDNDLCPYKFGYIKYQGCNDQDDDGIWDHVDVCPSLPGKIENHGCPVQLPGIDSDTDGIPDRYDQCIYIKGTAEHNGCPDTDADGISDLQDNCPYIKGTQENKGCPELGISAGYTEANKVSIDIVEFDTDDYKIAPSYFELLDRVALLLQTEPTYQLKIEGHTDNEGNATYNFQLSKHRANAIRDYLIAHGAPPDSISSYHFGENRPKSRNDSAFGKSRNRRAELVLIAKK